MEEERAATRLPSPSPDLLRDQHFASHGLKAERRKEVVMDKGQFGTGCLRRTERKEEEKRRRKAHHRVTIVAHDPTVLEEKSKHADERVGTKERWVARKHEKKKENEARLELTKLACPPSANTSQQSPARLR